MSSLLKFCLTIIENRGLRVNNFLPLPFLKFDDDFGVFAQWLCRDGLSFGPLARTNATGGQTEVDNLSKFINLVLKVTDGDISFFKGPFEYLDHFVATTKDLRSFIQKSFQISYRIHHSFIFFLTKVRLFLQPSLIHAPYAEILLYFSNHWHLSSNHFHWFCNYFDEGFRAPV